jgi:glycosyltransferase involved in cell wall biosynthesis
MACGKAVVVSDTPGFRELISDGETGLFAKAEDPQDLASAIDVLLSDSCLRHTLGAAAGRDIRARFRGNSVGKSILRVYQDATVVA